MWAIRYGVWRTTTDRPMRLSCHKPEVNVATGKLHNLGMVEMKETMKTGASHHILEYSSGPLVCLNGQRMEHPSVDPTVTLLSLICAEMLSKGTK